jgi:hypothetical protein
MINLDIIREKSKLDALFDNIKDLRKLNNYQIEAQWAVYLCIRVSGLLEASIRSIYVSYCEDKSHPHVAKYIAASFKSSRSKNMDPDTLLQLAGSFNPAWRIDLENFILENGRKEAIESVVSLSSTLYVQAA